MKPVNRLTSLLLIAVPVAFTVCFSLLQAQFEYPAILGQPTAEVLRKFQAGGPALIGAWYAIALTALLFIPVAVLVHRVVGERGGASMALATTFGVLAGLVQTLGFLRWTFAVPLLAERYLDPAASDAQRAAAGIVFEAFHRYIGGALGEHLGYLFTGLWTLLSAWALWRAGLVKGWLAAAGAATAIGVLAGLVGPSSAVGGWAWAGPVNAIGYLLWAGWLVAVGVALLLGGRRSRPSPAQAAVAG